MRYTTYHCGKAVIKDKSKLAEAMEKLAKFEDEEERKTTVPTQCIATVKVEVGYAVEMDELHITISDTKEIRRMQQYLSSDTKLAEWAESEYIETAKISKKDRAFLDYLKGYKCVARDDDGKLYAYISIPKKLLDCPCWGTDDDCKSLARLDIDFPMVKWSDAEPWKIEDLKDLEVCEKYGENI